jgi:hypothetical protein
MGSDLRFLPLINNSSMLWWNKQNRHPHFIRLHVRRSGNCMCAGIRYAGHCGSSIRASARVVCFLYSYILTVHSRCPIRPAFLMMALIIRHVYNPPTRSGSYTFTFPCLCETRKNYNYGGI